MQKLSPESSNLEICNYYSYNYSGFSMKPHSHAAVEIMYQNGGACDVLIFGAQKIKIALKKGQAVV
ncbi:MAG: hypothetical protein LBS99_07710, partial [Clostridiales bacterium]|nr:hypothetical protein [Clostridiales bacterium]